MNLSMKWLSEFVTLDPMSPREFAEAMTMSAPRSSWEIEGEKLDKVVVGQVLSIEKHPDADKLVVCQVDAGGEAPIQIVTGASNLTAGDKVPVAFRRLHPGKRHQNQKRQASRRGKLRHDVLPGRAGTDRSRTSPTLSRTAFSFSRRSASWDRISVPSSA